MGKAARKYTEKTLKRLFGLSGNICSYPDCDTLLVNKSNALDSNICHIEAANKGGERYNNLMSDEERADYPNLILLCRQCHDKTNDTSIYTVDVLRDMKIKHESSYLNQRLKNNPSMLKNTINAISNISLNAISDSEDFTVYDPKVKLNYNSIKTNYALIQEYKVYQGKINNLYDELEKQGSIKKEKLLSNVNQIYTKIKGSYVLDSDKTIEIVRLNSDKIFNEVYEEIHAQLQNSNFFEEDVVLGINLILVDAFIRCKILEEPIDNDNK
ncbi:MAG: ABC-three component system protein [Brumimicrobium sp.]